MKLRKIVVVYGWTSLTKSAEKPTFSAEFTPQLDPGISENAYFAKKDLPSEMAIIFSNEAEGKLRSQHTAHTERVCV